nr:hypothetical protein [Tanacetum cinerariifolium]
EEKLHEKRRVAYQLDVDPEDRREGLDLPGSDNRAHDAHADAEQGADGRQLQREQGSAKQQVSVLQDRNEVELISHLKASGQQSKIRDRPAEAAS